jgi:tRNA threonylcarbamoyladenosine dehydratase
MYSINAPEFHRNYGFWDEAEQQAIMDSHVAIAGVGGDGFELGQRLARMGVANFAVADPEVFEPENVNRVPGATSETVGQKKVDVFRASVLAINPDANVRVFSDGITEGNIEDFMDGATLAYDETELTHLELGTMVAREARRRRIVNVLVMNVGFAAQVTSFDPEDTRHTFERMMGFRNDTPLSEVARMDLDLSRCVPYIPHYIDVETFKEVGRGAPLPSIVHGIGVASAMGASQGFLHMTKGAGNRRPEPVWAPKMAWSDSLTNESRVTRFPRLSHYRHLSAMVLNNMLGRNARASYSAEDRDRRSEAHAQELLRRQQAAQ